MTLQDYLRVLREQWVIVLMALVLGLAGAGAAWFLRPADYTATLQLYVSAQGGDTPNAAYQGAQLSEQRVKSYTALLTSARVSGEVVSRLGLAETPEALAKQVTATSKLDSVLIDLAVTDYSPLRAAQLVNAIGEVFPRLVADIERPVRP
ncbi:MAG: tyrosine-protein kinase, partial [Pseudonocardiales bacterium]|nr:tyrosine-protein kinase [Pseudonocardiales bacterium]